jgi:leader peptidase (prepilin peptidase) / N-methyltransferase
VKRTAPICTLIGATVLIEASARFTLGPLAVARLLVLSGTLGMLAFHDIREHLIPNRIVLPAAAVCAALSFAEGIRPSAGLFAGAALVALLLTVSLAAPTMLGMGDVKLALLILCAVGALAALAFLAALELYALVAITLLISRGRSALGTHLPLAPIIAAGCLITVLL